MRDYGRPTLVLSHNKTLAAQLYGELKSFFPHNAVEYFISYYDYYQPEAYVPTDRHVHREGRLDQRGHRPAAAARDVEPDGARGRDHRRHGVGDLRPGRPGARTASTMVTLAVGQRIARDDILRSLVKIQYYRNDVAFERGTFRVRGDTVEIFPAYEEQGVRVEMWGDEIERISKIDPLTGETIASSTTAAIYPAKHFVTHAADARAGGGAHPRGAGRSGSPMLREANKLLEAQRLESRTNFDIEMMLEIGTCAGIENYSRHLSARGEGERPACLFDYFPEDFLVVVDESHVTLPQIGGHVQRRPGAQADAGRVRVPAAERARQPAADVRRVPAAHAAGHQSCRRRRASWSCELSQGVVVEQIIRPTGLVDPEIEIRPVRGQVDDLLDEIRIRERTRRARAGTTLTKRMAEDLTDYLQQVGVRVRYMHSDIDAIERMEIVRGLRLGEFDVLVGINLLREGLDLPRCRWSRSSTPTRRGSCAATASLIQTVGRAARHVSGRAIFYADRVTGSMQRAIDETSRRREIQRGVQRRARHHAAGRGEERRRGAVHHAGGRRPRGAKRARDRTHAEAAARARERLDADGIRRSLGADRELEQQMRDAAPRTWTSSGAARLRDQLFDIRREDGATARGTEPRHRTCAPRAAARRRNVRTVLSRRTRAAAAEARVLIR